MKELSLHILDIVENSTRAGAKMVEIIIEEQKECDNLRIRINDDGHGMDEETLKGVFNPFFTTKKVRRVGIGLSLFKEAAVRAGGDLQIESWLNRGTSVTAIFKYSHIDRQPIGDMASTITTILMSNPGLDIMYMHVLNGDSFVFDTRIVRSVLLDVDISNPDVMKFIAEVIRSRQNLE